MEVTRLFDFIYYQNEKYPKPDSICGKKPDGSWRKYSTSEVIDTINQVSRAFLKAGLKKDDKVAIVSNNRPEWNFIDLGMMQLGIVNIPVYPTISENEYKFIFNDAEVKMVFVSDADLYQKISNIKKDVPSLQEIYTFDHVQGAKDVKDFFDGAEDKSNQAAVDEIKNSIEPGELATIIYTSGTTGTPKGVMLSHNNVVSNVKTTATQLPINNENRALSFLPLCHIFERMVSYTYMYLGISIYYAESMETIADNLKEVKPHLFSTVPRLLEKVYEKIVGKGMELTGVKKKMFFWALDLGLKYDPNISQGFFYNFQLKLANKLIFSKWREALGGNIVGIVTGAAACPAKLSRVFSAGQIPIKEGYGQSESSPVLTFNRFEDGGTKFGTVGKVIPGVELKIAEDGEIIARGPNVMMGYYKRPDLTAEAIDEEGWLHTGDIGVIDNDGFLKITDRKKELFKTSGGKYVAPQPIENKMKESFYIEQIMVIGENQKYVAAMVVPSFEKLEMYCKEKGVSYGTREEMVEHPQVRALLKKEIDNYNKEFSHIEQIKNFRILPNEWTIEGGELTPTMKVKRKFIMNKYANIVEGVYAGDSVTA